MALLLSVSLRLPSVPFWSLSLHLAFLGSEAVDITETKLPANGSNGKISFEIRENSYGTFAKLRNVLVTDLIEYKKSSTNGASDFGLEIQETSDFDTPEQPVTKQPKPVTVPDNADDEESLPFWCYNVTNRECISTLSVI